MKKIIIVIAFFVSACGSPIPRFSPGGNELPEGVVGQDYLSEVEITNAVLLKGNIGVDISPPASGLRWQPRVNILKRGGKEREEEDYHYIIISGNPKAEGDITLHINGHSMGTMTPGSEIDKKYIIKIKGKEN